MYQCTYYGCTKPRFKDINGRIHDYCSKQHAQASGSFPKNINPNASSSRTVSEVNVKYGAYPCDHVLVLHSGLDECYSTVLSALSAGLKDLGVKVELSHATNLSELSNVMANRPSIMAVVMAISILRSSHAQTVTNVITKPIICMDHMEPDVRTAVSQLRELFKKQVKEIKFFDQSGPFFELSNLFPCTINLDDKTWLSSEQYFQAQKYVSHPKAMEYIRNLGNPRESIDFSRSSQAPPIRSDWRTVRLAAMYKVVAAKFNQNPQLKQLLLSTGEAKLIAHTINDKFWGDAGDGTGANHLGAILQKVRTKALQRTVTTNTYVMNQTNYENPSQSPLASLNGLQEFNIVRNQDNMQVGDVIKSIQLMPQLNDNVYPPSAPMVENSYLSPRQTFHATHTITSNSLGSPQYSSIYPTI